MDTIAADTLARLHRDEIGLPDDAVPASTTIEATLLHIWGTVLQIDGIGVDDDFFDLGGDSLGGAEIMAAIEASLKVVIPVSALLEARTPRTLAKLVEDARANIPGRCLIPIRPEGEGPPIFCVHGLNGDAVFANTLAAVLAKRRPIYGLRASGLSQDEPILQRIDAMAEKYLSEIRRVRPEGPYLIMGYCGGSWIALEIAQKLSRDGHAIPGLIFIEPPASRGNSPWMMSSGTELVWRRFHAALRGEYLRVRSLVQRGGEARRDFVYKQLQSAIRIYVPERYPGEIFVAHATNRTDALRDPLRGLPSIAGKVTFEVVGPDHNSVFSSHMPAAAAAIDTFLDRVAPI
jgi:thioesterase domain-containing protein/acyl carrier protein